MTTNPSISKKAQKLLDRIHAIGPFVEASLTVTRKKCVNPGCRCSRRGPIHKVALLTWKEKQRTRTLYVRIDDRKEVQKWVAEGKRLKRLIKAMSEAQRETLRKGNNRRRS